MYPVNQFFLIKWSVLCILAWSWIAILLCTVICLPTWSEITCHWIELQFRKKTRMLTLKTSSHVTIRVFCFVNHTERTEYMKYTAIFSFRSTEHFSSSLSLCILYLCRHHTYKKTDQKNIELTEVGPRFEMKCECSGACLFLLNWWSAFYSLSVNFFLFYFKSKKFPILTNKCSWPHFGICDWILS